METKILSGEDYTHLIRKIYQGPNGLTGLRYLDNWVQPLVFYPKTRILKQYSQGPCGYFAVLQSYIRFLLQEGENADTSNYDLLAMAIIKIQTLIGGKYCFFVEYNDIEKQSLYVETDSADDALIYILDSGILNESRASMLILLGMLQTCSNNDWFWEINPLVSPDKNSSLSLVFLLLVGTLSVDIISSVESNDGFYHKQPHIGLYVKSNNTEVAGFHLNRSAKIFVVLYQFHLFAVEDVNGVITKYDTLFEKNNLKQEPRSQFLN